MASAPPAQSLCWSQTNAGVNAIAVGLRLHAAECALLLADVCGGLACVPVKLSIRAISRLPTVGSSTEGELLRCCYRDCA